MTCGVSPLIAHMRRVSAVSGDIPGLSRRRGWMRRSVRNSIETVIFRLAILLIVLSLLPVGLAVARGQGTHDPRLRPVAADIQRARSLLVTKADLPHGFHIYREQGDQLPKFTGLCGTLADPDLSALTETANVAGRVLANTYSGAEYLPTAYVFASAGQAARAQTLETGPDFVKCAASLAKKRLMLLGGPYTVTGETPHIVARTEGGVVVRARQVILDVKVSPNYPFRLEVSFIFLRRGRALSEIRTSSPWGADTRRTWNETVDAGARRLKRSGS